LVLREYHNFIGNVYVVCTVHGGWRWSGEGWIPDRVRDDSGICIKHME
jgi:hypothetical protein